MTGAGMATDAEIENLARRLAVMDLAERLMGVSPADPRAAEVADWLAFDVDAPKPSGRVEYLCIHPDSATPAWHRYRAAAAGLLA